MEDWATLHQNPHALFQNGHPAIKFDVDHCPLNERCKQEDKLSESKFEFHRCLSPKKAFRLYVPTQMYPTTSVNVFGPVIVKEAPDTLVMPRMEFDAVV